MEATRPSPAKQDVHGDRAVMMSLSLVAQIGCLTAFPVTILGFGGAYLDKYLGTSPLFVLLGFAIAFISSAVAIFYRVRDVMREEFSTDTPPSPPSS